MTNLLFALLDAAPAGEAPQQSMMPTIIMLVVMFAIIYLFMIRPQNKKQKKIQEFRNSLKNGQEVVTIGGIHGVIKDIDETTGVVTLEVASGVKMKFEKSAIMPNGVPAGK